jgi:hypothetical protein
MEELLYVFTNVIMMMIMSMGWDYASELRPQRCPLFIPQVIYEHELWWNDIDRGNSWFVHQSSLAFLPAESSSSKAGVTGEGNYEFSIWSIFVYISKGFLTCRKISRMGPTALLALRRKACCWLIGLKNPSLSAGFENVNLGSNDNHANHYATEDD